MFAVQCMYHLKRPRLKEVFLCFAKKLYYKQGDRNHKPPAVDYISEFSVWGPKDRNCWVSTKRSWKCWGLLTLLYKQEVSSRRLLPILKLNHVESDVTISERLTTQNRDLNHESEGRIPGLEWILEKSLLVIYHLSSRFMAAMGEK